MSLIRGNALAVPLAAESVDAVITSPPYFALRSYTDACGTCGGLDPKVIPAQSPPSPKSTLKHDGRKNPKPVGSYEEGPKAVAPDPDCPDCNGTGRGHYDGQIGSEATPADFIAALLAVTRECVRVLKPSGSLWVNLGDKYARKSQNEHTAADTSNTDSGNARRIMQRQLSATKAQDETGGMRTKSLMGLPWRYALGCIDDLGLILRAEVIWCLSGGARVYAEIKGEPRPVMLRDLVRHYQPEDVRLWNGGKWTQVLGWNKSADTDGALEFELRSGERIGCTPGHQWPTDRGLVRADEVRVGDVFDTTKLPAGSRTPDGLTDDEVGWFVGLYMAEGSRSENMIQFAGHANETLRHERLARIAEMYDGTCAVYQTGENVATANLSGSVLVGILDRYLSPGTAKTKRLTMHAWARSDDFLAGVMEGYLDGDGYYDAKNDRYRLGFAANDEWAADLRTIASRLGASLTLKRCVHRGNYGDFPGWRGEWRWTPSDHHNTKSRSEVVAIRASRARQFFDVGVADEPHLFALASGVLTHNSKPNGLPESVQDRVRRSHEQWFHFTKEPRYFSAVDEIREDYSERVQDRQRYAGRDIEPSGGYTGTGLNADGGRGILGLGAKGMSPLGKLPGSVWTIATEPLRVPDHLPQHFAAFPSEWPKRIILGWSPSGVCVECGEGRRPVVDVERIERNSGGLSVRNGDERGVSATSVMRTNAIPVSTITGESCACPTPDAPTRPAIVLDPFAGTGTTVAVANALGRHGIGLDLSADYLKLARWRCQDPGLRAKVLGVDKPAPECDGQLTLLGGV